MTKCFPHQMSKNFHISKWISFAISTQNMYPETMKKNVGAVWELPVK